MARERVKETPTIGSIIQNMGKVLRAERMNKKRK